MNKRGRRENEQLVMKFIEIEKRNENRYRNDDYGEYTGTDFMMVETLSIHSERVHIGWAEVELTPQII
ncbi:hypothetical protein AKJ16_DCAP10835 [Drosera capensis]